MVVVVHYQGLDAPPVFSYFPIVVITDSSMDHVTKKKGRQQMRKIL